MQPLVLYLMNIINLLYIYILILMGESLCLACFGGGIHADVALSFDATVPHALPLVCCGFCSMHPCTDSFSDA